MVDQKIKEAADAVAKALEPWFGKVDVTELDVWWASGRVPRTQIKLSAEVRERDWTAEYIPK